MKKHVSQSILYLQVVVHLLRMMTKNCAEMQIYLNMDKVVTRIEKCIHRFKYNKKQNN
jgi:hypothetical protein